MRAAAQASEACAAPEEKDAKLGRSPFSCPNAAAGFPEGRGNPAQGGFPLGTLAQRGWGRSPVTPSAGPARAAPRPEDLPGTTWRQTLPDPSVHTDLGARAAVLGPRGGSPPPAPAPGGGAPRRPGGPSLCHPPREARGSTTPPPTPPRCSRLTSTPLRPPSPPLLCAVPPSVIPLRAAAPRTSDSSRRWDPPPRAMEPAAGSERRSPSGPAVPPSPRGHAPLAAAPGLLGSPAREPPQPEEGQQLRISQSGQFSDGLEDRGERAPPGAFPGRVGAVRSRLYPLPWAGSEALGDAELGLPSGGAEIRERPAPPRRPLLPRNPRARCLPGKRVGARAFLSGVHGKSLREEVFLPSRPSAPRGLWAPLSSKGPEFVRSSSPRPLRSPPAPQRTSLCGFSLQGFPGGRWAAPDSFRRHLVFCGALAPCCLVMRAEDWYTWVWTTNTIWMNATETWWFPERTSPPPANCFQDTGLEPRKPPFPGRPDPTFLPTSMSGLSCPHETRERLPCSFSRLSSPPSSLFPPFIVSFRLGALILATSIPFLLFAESKSGPSERLWFC